MALDSEQRRNAAIIQQVGREVGASDRDIMIAIMTAMQESSLRAGLSEGQSDRDSAGLFQQRRPWAPGGSQSYRQNPYNATRMFFLGGAGGQRGLLDFSSRNRMSLSQAAQAVQVSAYPSAYAKHEGTARQLMGQPQTGLTARGGARPGSWIRPVESGRITQNFGDAPPRGVTYAGGTKNGTSFAAPGGSPVYAASDGRVVRVTSGGAYGTRIELEHNGKVWSLYAHLSGTNVKVGDDVRAGQRIGSVGDTGQTTGPHLHFEVRQGSNSYGAAVDPMSYLNNNSTPEAYVDDAAFEYDTLVQGQAADFMDIGGPDSRLFAPERPYIYRTPYDVNGSRWAQPDDPLERLGQRTGGESFGSLVTNLDEVEDGRESAEDAVLEEVL